MTRVSAIWVQQVDLKLIVTISFDRDWFSVYQIQSTGEIFEHVDLYAILDCID